MPEHDLTGRVAIVTGGNQGIGRAIAHDYADHGADVVIASRTLSTAEAVAEEVRARGRKALAISTDVASNAEVVRMVQQTMDTFGRVDILVNNAGGSHGRTYNRGALLEITEEDWDNSMAVNLKSVWLCSRAVAPIMQRQGRGAILNIGSVSAQIQHGTRVGFAVYSAAKVGVNNLTYSMAAEWGPTIRVNGILPGFIETPRVTPTRSEEGNAVRTRAIALGRFGASEELAKAATFLVSDEAGYISGTIIEVHGGYKSSLPPLEAVH
ncbi:MAG: SDR family oxidoreductase [Dehalococcoidia bacterium]|nr:SDR family oxidoreductase [Dehalococcoidia bacterium]